MARRYGLAPALHLATGTARDGAAAALFAPVVVEPPVWEPAPLRHKARRARHDGIELEIDGATVRVGGGAQAKTVAAVIRALKAQR